MLKIDRLMSSNELNNSESPKKQNSSIFSKITSYAQRVISKGTEAIGFQRAPVADLNLPAPEVVELPEQNQPRRSTRVRTAPLRLSYGPGFRQING